MLRTGWRRSGCLLLAVAMVGVVLLIFDVVLGPTAGYCRRRSCRRRPARPLGGAAAHHPRTARSAIPERPADGSLRPSGPAARPTPRWGTNLPPAERRSSGRADDGEACGRGGWPHGHPPLLRQRPDGCNRSSRELLEQVVRLADGCVDELGDGLGVAAGQVADRLVLEGVDELDGQLEVARDGLLVGVDRLRGDLLDLGGERL